MFLNCVHIWSAQLYFNLFTTICRKISKPHHLILYSQVRNSRTHLRQTKRHKEVRKNKEKKWMPLTKAKKNLYDSPHTNNIHNLNERYSLVIQVSHPVLFWLLGSWLMISWDRKSSRWMVLLKRLSCSPKPSPEVASDRAPEMASADWPEPEEESSIMAGNLNSPIFPNSSWVMFVCVEFAWSYLANLWPWLGCASMVPNTANLKGQWLIIICGIIDYAKKELVCKQKVHLMHKGSRRNIWI